MAVIEALAAGVPGGVDRRRRRRRRRRRTARPASSCPPATSGDSPSASRGSRPTPSLRRELGAGGADWVRARYSVPRLVDDVDTLYRALLEAPGARAGPRRRRPLAPATPHDVRAITRAPRSLASSSLSQYFPPEVGATQSRMQSFAEYLARARARRDRDRRVPEPSVRGRPGALPRPPRRRRPLERLPGAARLGQGERGEDAAHAARLLPLVLGARDGDGAARPAARTWWSRPRRRSSRRSPGARSRG